MREISERELELPDAVIGKLLKIASESKDIISLGPGEPDFKLPRPLIKEVKKVAKNCNHYSPPGGRSDLKEEIIKKLKRDNKIKARPEEIIITCGSQEALALATACTLDVSEQVIIPNPGYMGFLPTFELFNASPRFVDLKYENNFEINPDEVKKVIDKKKTNVLIINSPANPTGNIIRKKILEELADLAVQYNFYIFSDEAYEKIIYNKKHISIGSLNGMEDYVLTFHSFSKTYAMCGFRVGYCVAPKEIAQGMVRSHVYTSICSPTISQLVAKKALTLPSKYTNRMVKEYRKRRDYLVERLNELNLTTNMPDGAFYTFSNIKGITKKNSLNFSKDLLKKAKVAVVPGTEFGNAGEGFIRCSYATDLSLIKKAMDKIEKFLLKTK